MPIPSTTFACPAFAQAPLVSYVNDFRYLGILFGAPSFSAGVGLEKIDSNLYGLTGLDNAGMVPGSCAHGIDLHFVEPGTNNPASVDTVEFDIGDSGGDTDQWIIEGFDYEDTRVFLQAPTAQFSTHVVVHAPCRIHRVRISNDVSPLGYGILSLCFTPPQADVAPAVCPITVNGLPTTNGAVVTTPVGSSVTVQCQVSDPDLCEAVQYTVSPSAPFLAGSTSGTFTSFPAPIALNGSIGVVDAGTDYPIVITATDAAGVTSDCAVTLHVPALPCTPPPANMVGWWPLDGQNPFRDIWGGNGGAPTGCGGQSAALVQGSVYFCGTAGIEVPDPSSLVLDPGAIGSSNPDFSIDAWIDPTNPPVVSGPPSHFSTIVGKYHWGHLAAANYGYVFGYDETSADLRLEITEGGHVATCHSNPFPYPPGWHHVAVSVDRTLTPDGVRFYIDGARVDDGLQNCVAVTGSLDTTEPFSIGYVTNYGYGFHGNIDEVEMFSRALAASEINAIYFSGTTGKCRGSVLAPTPAVSPWLLFWGSVVLAAIGLARLRRARFDGA